MNAKITITIPIEKVPSKVTQILYDVSTELDELSNAVKEVSKCVIKEDDLMKQLQLIDMHRKKLALLDANLDDCYSVLVGLVNYKTKDSKDAPQQAE